MALLLGAMLLLATPATAAATTLRVGLVESAQQVLVASSVAAEVTDARGKAIARLPALEGYTASSVNGAVQLAGPNGTNYMLAGPIRIRPLSASGIPLVYAGDRWYRGHLEVRTAGSAITAVNVVGIEDYLYGVVPAEMPKHWPSESLKAQSVAARSYAVANAGKHRSRGYDVCDTTDCQVYGGAAAEAAVTNQMIDATRGEYLMHNGRVVPGYFHSAAGGYTENSEDVWHEKLDYIRAVPDFDQNAPSFTWYKTVAAGALADGLARQGVKLGQILQVVPLNRSYSGRVRDVQVVGTAGSRVVKGEAFRLAAGLNSTLFNVAAVGGNTPSSFSFAGRGWGHGLGLSQWGAKGLAEKGYGYMQILGHYFPGAQLGKQ